MIQIAIELFKKYLPQIIGAVLILAGYFLWHHSVVTDTENRVNAEWEARDADTARQSAELLERKQHEHDLELKRQQDTYIGAIESYAEHIESLNHIIVADRDKRLFVNTKAASCSGRSMPTKTGSSEANSGRSREIYVTELEPETTQTIRSNAAEVERGKLACAELLTIVKSGMVIK